MENNNHGGARAGSGRKTKYENTVVMRVPEKYRDVIKALIKHLDDTDYIDSHYKGTESDPVYMRSLKDKNQHITFRTEPFKNEI